MFKHETCNKTSRTVDWPYEVLEAVKAAFLIFNLKSITRWKGVEREKKHLERVLLVWKKCHLFL